MRAHFLGFELDDERRELRREGRPLAVEPRVFDLIAYLVKHRDRVVEKDELLERLWPDSLVQEGALSVCVHRARRLLEARERESIRTVARRGFRFVAPVEYPLRVQRGAFVGREPELELLLAAVEGLPQSGLRSFELRGGPGSGKSALLEELGTQARRRRIEVLRAAPSGEAAPDYDLWVQVISAFMTRYDARSVQRSMGELVDVLAWVVPVLRRWASPDWSQKAEPSQERLCQALNRAVMAATSTQSVLLTFDDAQNVDAASLTMLQQVMKGCREAPSLIGIAFRADADSSPELRAVLEQMRERPGHLRIELSALPDAVLEHQQHTP